MQPFKLEPVYKDYPWGGTKLKSQWGKKINMPIIAESWELSAHPDGDCRITTGPLKGSTLSEFFENYPELCGTGCRGFSRFPIMIKLIDSQQNLSIQVHPGDDFAYREENEPGKTEMWVILDCEPGAFLYFGFKEAVCSQEVRRRIKDGSLTDILNPVQVQPGDVYFIEAGTVHAIGAGITLAEIQQNSNITYRLYDFGRRDAQGRQRPLHVNKAMQVARLSPAKGKLNINHTMKTHSYSTNTLAVCEYFTARMLELGGTYTQVLDGSSFYCLLCVEGNAYLTSEGEAVELNKGDCAFVPASLRYYTLNGQGNFLLTNI